MTIKEWHQNPSLREHLAKSPAFALAMSVLESERLVRKALPITDFAFSFGQETGFQHALNVLDDLVRPPVTVDQPLEATYQPTNEDANSPTV